MSKANFYQQHLDKVSRSFAVCIAQLKSPLQEWVGLSYLLLRTLDTIEDAPWDCPQKKQEAFRLFDSCLQNPLGELPQRHIMTLLPFNIPDSEKELAADFPLLLNDFWSLPIKIRACLQNTVLSMSRGMQYFTLRSNSAELRLKNLKEVNQYCFFVAGIVGELLTQFLQNLSDNSQLTKTLQLNAIRFGICLQKVNLLKDQSEDEKHGRFLIPNRELVFKSFTKDAEGALDYLLEIPLHFRDYRLFCAWSLFLGLSSLTWMQANLVQSLMSKIPRSVTQALFSSIENIIDDNQKLISHFQKMMSTLQSSKPSRNLAEGTKDSGLWILQVYSGKLNQNDLFELGLV